jgi:hypothetical protein
VVTDSHAAPKQKQSRGGPKVWKKFGLRKEHRRLQGSIHSKRCGVTENIGETARDRMEGKQDRSNDAGAIVELDPRFRLLASGSCVESKTALAAVAARGQALIACDNNSLTFTAHARCSRQQ